MDRFAPSSWPRTLATLAAMCALVSACGGSSSPLTEPPVGEPVLPDLMPAPPVDMQMLHERDKWYIRFSSTLVNVGNGDFVLVATRGIREWRVEQGIIYSTSGAKFVRVRAPIVWGGDGHEHWHVSRVATMRLVAMDDQGRPVPERGLVDAKVGFCFFDQKPTLGRGPEKPVYNRLSCGHEDYSEIGMGLSPGWGDTYRFILPGQRIDVTDVPDGRYRLWASADEAAWFRETTRANNRTWVDIELSTKEDQRFALVVKVGPKPE
jgi:hypothetical protein